MPESNPLVNVRIARKIRSEQGVILRVEDAGGWIVNPEEFPNSPKMTYIRKTLKEFQEEEPNAGWDIECRGTESGWHPLNGDYR